MPEMDSERLKFTVPSAVMGLAEFQAFIFYKISATTVNFIYIKVSTEMLGLITLCRFDAAGVGFSFQY